MRLPFRRGRHEGADRPTHPIYSDQRKFGLTLALRSKLFLLVLTFLVVTLAGETLYLLHLHSQGVKDRTQLACLLVEDTPPGNQLGDEVREKYHCPAYDPNRLRTTPTSSSPATVAPTVTAPPRAHPSTPSTRPTPGATATVTHVRTQPTTRTVPAPGKTVTRTKTQKPPPPPSSTSQLCAVLPIICQLPVP